MSLWSRVQCRVLIRVPILVWSGEKYVSLVSTAHEARGRKNRVRAARAGLAAGGVAKMSACAVCEQRCGAGAIVHAQWVHALCGGWRKVCRFSYEHGKLRRAHGCLHCTRCLILRCGRSHVCIVRWLRQT